jgi:hypothetical protein
MRTVIGCAQPVLEKHRARLRPADLDGVRAVCDHSTAQTDQLGNVQQRVSTMSMIRAQRARAASG